MSSLCTEQHRERQRESESSSVSWRDNQGSQIGNEMEVGDTVVWCEGVGDVVGVEALLGGVAQVIFHGVQVVEVGVQVMVHQDRGVEEDGEGQVEVEREVEEVREKRTYTWCGDGMTDR